MDRARGAGEPKSSCIVEEVVTALTARHQRGERIDLNDIAEVIGERAVSYDEVDEIILRLEQTGWPVGELPDQADVELLERVLSAARELTGELGRRPTVRELAERIGVPGYAVRRALEHGQLAGKSLKVD